MDKQRKPWWQQLEKGQALVEYWPAIPAAILVMIVAGGVVGFLHNSFSRTNEALGRAGLDAQVCSAPSVDEGPSVASVSNHQVQATSAVYDGEYTTVTFTVSSGNSPSISHWVIGLSREVADNIVDANEQWGWVNNDPSAPSGNGLTGIKFDTGYEGTGGGGGGNGGGGGGNGGGNGGGRGRHITFVRIPLTLAGTSTTYFVETRDIIIVLSGEYEMGTVDLAIKAGTEYDLGTISGPVAVVDDSANSGGNSGQGNGCG
jgi:hypothetical protein